VLEVRNEDGYEERIKVVKKNFDRVNRIRKLKGCNLLGLHP
jgi:hypothetical protein